jgi:hypothetical protein
LAAALVIGGDPPLEIRCDETARCVLVGCGAGGQMVGVLVVRMSDVTTDPSPLTLVPTIANGGDRLEPQGEILDRATFAPPSARGPSEHPLLKAIDEVLGVAREDDTQRDAFGGQSAERFDDRAECHAVVRRRWIGNPKIAAHDGAGFRMQEFNQSGGASRCIAILSIAQTRLVGVDCHQRIRGCSAQRRVASHGALTADDGFDGVELVEVERESVSCGRVEGIDHLTPGHRSESLRHNDILGAAPRDRDAAAIDDRAFEGFVLGVSQCRHGLATGG